MSPKKSFLFLSLIFLITSIGSTIIAATPAEIEEAIDDGVAWLVDQQNPAGYWQDGSYIAGPTGLALIKLEERAFELRYTPFDPCYPYKENVENGLEYLFSQMSIISTPNQPAGNPDTDGDGSGVYVNTNLPIYETGIVMMTIAASRNPDRLVDSPGSPVNGWTYKQVLVDMVDYMAFGQCDSGSGRGGWRYSPNSGADNSCAGFAVSGLGYAESPRYGFNCTIPQFVKDELKIWIDYIQTDGGADDGGSGYTAPGSANILRTGNLIFQMTFAEITPEDPNFQRALAYIGRNWSSGWSGDCQAMYCAANGLWYSDVNTIVVDGNERDWYSDFADNLINTQQSTGYWYSSYGNVLGTEWALLALEMPTSGPRPPIIELTKVDDVNDGDCVGPGDEITYTICYSYSNEPNLLVINDVNIIDYLPEEVNYVSSSPPGDYNDANHTVTWQIGTISPGDANCFTLTVQVKENIERCITITNCCDIKSGEATLFKACESTCARCPTLTKVSDVGCVVIGDYINYTICYAANGCNDTNVAIIDFLPSEVNFVSAGGATDYNSLSHTVTWNLGELGPDAYGCFSLRVQVNTKAEPNGIITNCCQMTGDLMGNILSCTKCRVRINFRDYAIFADDWWRCIEPGDASCEKPWLNGGGPEVVYEVINIDLTGKVNDPPYIGQGPVANSNWDIDEPWKTYYQGEGRLFTSPRCKNIGVPGSPATYAKAVFLVDPCSHSYISGESGMGKLLGDGFVSDYTGTDPNLFPKLYIYGNWAYGGIFDVYITIAGAPNGQVIMRDGKGNIFGPNTLTGVNNENNWVEGDNYVKFSDVWVGGTDTRNANGQDPNYIDYEEYFTDPNCLVIGYNNQIDGIQLASVKRRVRAAGLPADPCIVAKEVPGGNEYRKKVKGTWPVEIPMAVIKMMGSSNRTNLLCGDYDAYYETNALAGEPDYDGPDAMWTGASEPLIGYVDNQAWVVDGYMSYVESGEWMEYDLIATTDTKAMYKVRALVNCWWGPADIGVFIDQSVELGEMELEKYEEMSPAETDANAIYWTNYIDFMLFSGYHRLRLRQNGAYYNILGFQIAYDSTLVVNNCSDVYNYGFGIPGDLNRDCYVNWYDLELFVENWLHCVPCNP